MSRPPINPEQTTAGIALDPQTLERVIPESRRPDGTFRKQIKIRPGFTPQEDVRRFRGTKQAQMDVNALPKGHIIGWAPPPTSTAASGSNGTKALSKSAKKNAKRKEKREKDKDAVPDNWDDEDEGSSNTTPVSKDLKDGEAVGPDTNAGSREAGAAGLASELEKLSVK
ncbi:uncharacterized protein LACBIDRAFT_292861 [Laccaria bicolor S238N-H82]|uniref:Predicted protein n=1 Tax=Laccaria bicolor (strain S238N-H82 / ATCC MYA-4686) TaxID=486041 RepID=B0CY51_LACBS|nr:uncharacterized protein LACBIDRAFT_292861 [Laccaria bicolor S238N-H82]EDR12384.1 predicted protein [Laccaria bicolor S238N-H82]|eukprot:XP_001876648.1 predicted protein [Laccaria bicolor S238N-H82]